MILSIVVPIYNVEKYISECLDSLINQNIDKSEYEIICVDDKSTDNSAEIVEKFIKTNKNIKLLRLSENKGVSGARNAGIEEAKGDYIWFVDSDDFIAPNCLKDIFDTIQSSNADTIFIKPISFKDGIDTSIYKNNEVKEDETTKTYEKWLWTRIIKRNILDNNSVRFHEKVFYAEDNLFCTILGKYISNFYNFNKVCYFYRIRRNSLSTTATKNRINSLIVSAKTINDILKSKEIYTGSLKYDVYNFVIMILFECSKMPFYKDRKTLKKLKEYHLFPLKNYDRIFYEYDGNDNVTKALTDLKNKCYTVKNYRKLRRFRFWLKIKRKFKSIFG